MELPRITDLAALALHRRRALRAPVDFLQELAIAEVQERLELVKKPLPELAIVTWRGDLWAKNFPNARIFPEAEVLNLPQSQFDCVVLPMGLHWANDPVGQLVQARLGLKPDGLLLAITLGGDTLLELRTALTLAESEVTGGLSPRVVPMGEIRDLGALLQRAGLALPVADATRLTVTYSDTFALMRDLRAMGESNALAARLRHPTRRAVLARAAEIMTRDFAPETGRIAVTFELVALTGWAPDASQPKPLRPGSAAARLADALGTTEGKL